MEWIIESERLLLRKITKADFSDLKHILQDIETMYAWEHAFSDDEVSEWIDKNLARYESDGFSYLAAIHRATGQLVGVMGPLIETVEGIRHMGVAYILDKQYWGQGYATEGARACMEYAFHTLNATEVIAEIRPENLPSQRVAQRLGMNVTGQFIKHYNGKDMLHLIYSRKADG